MKWHHFVETKYDTIIPTFAYLQFGQSFFTAFYIGLCNTVNVIPIIIEKAFLYFPVLLVFTDT